MARDKQLFRGEPLDTDPDRMLARAAVIEVSDNGEVGHLFQRLITYAAGLEQRIEVLERKLSEIR